MISINFHLAFDLNMIDGLLLDQFHTINQQKKKQGIKRER